jgi:ABC-type glutathione transport system ATPase component
MAPASDLLRVENLSISFSLLGGRIEAVKRADLRVLPGKVTALVGESGSGKSVISQAVMGILPKSATSAGRIIFHDAARGKAPVDLLTLPQDGREMRALRGARMGMIFQEPMTSLSPLHTIGNQIEEVLIHPHRAVEGRTPRGDRGDAVARRLQGSGARLRHVSFRTVGRPAPARDDRDGADLPAGAADRRRADDGARRHHPGADPEACFASCRKSSTWRCC